MNEKESVVALVAQMCNPEGHFQTKTNNSTESSNTTNAPDKNGGARPKTIKTHSRKPYKQRDIDDKGKRSKSAYVSYDRGDNTSRNTTENDVRTPTKHTSFISRGMSLEREEAVHRNKQQSWGGRGRANRSTRENKGDMFWQQKRGQSSRYDCSSSCSDLRDTMFNRDFNTEPGKITLPAKERDNEKSYRQMHGNSSRFGSARGVRKSCSDQRSTTLDVASDSGLERETNTDSNAEKKQRNNYQNDCRKIKDISVRKPDKDVFSPVEPDTDRQEINQGFSEDKQNRKKRILGYPFLKSLLGRGPGYIIIELTKAKASLEDCLRRNAEEWEFLELFLEVLNEVITSRTTPNMMISLYQTLHGVNFFDTVILYLIDVITITTEESANIRQKETVLVNILNIIIEQITRNPSSIHSFARIHTLIGQVISTLMRCGTVKDEVVSKYQAFTEEKKKMNSSSQTNFKNTFDRKPPNDFRECLVSPSPQEITGTIRPFLRANKTEGRYENLDHYLDVQFRLLKEDFVGPLREGLTEHIERATRPRDKKELGKDLKKLDIKVYEGVQFHTPVVTEHGLCYKLKMEMTSRLRSINWEFSQRLKYGSLICLTDSEFSSFYLATVEEKEFIKDGYLIVHFEDENVSTYDIIQRKFQMIESNAYFEPYRHVLSSLQTFREGDLPFEQYIVNCQTNIEKPKYLPQNCKYDLRPLVDDEYELQSERRIQEIGARIRASTSFQFNRKSSAAKSINVCNTADWPSKELLRLDESQYKAIQTALTKEFTIIQGPPGTGKTYIGLQIVKTLLHNRTVWSGSGNTVCPILIVCYTNHALDQFLEGIHKFFKGDIIRVGGRSNSTVLRDYNLKYYRQLHQPLRSTLGQLQLTRKQALDDLNKQQLNLQELTTAIDVYVSEIVGENFLRQEIGPRLFHSLINDYGGKVGKGFSYILKWLGINHTKAQCWQQVQDEDIANPDQYVNVEDNIHHTAQTMFVEDNDDNSRFLDENAEQLLRKIRRKSGVVFNVDRDKCVVKKENIRKGEWLDIRYNRILRNTIESKITNSDVMTEDEARHIKNVWRLNHITKWRLYRYWIQKLCMKQYEKIEARRHEFEEASERYREAQNQENKGILNQASVIGMTTSCAARLQSVLRDIAPRIIIAEEAAEVLEAHIITTLSKGCEHLILIGDHKQLRPNPNVYRLATRYKLNISLFERMIKNGMSYETLELQHRMRPEISSIVKHIYPDRQDHDHVKEYPDVMGVTENVYLINHTNLESTDNELKSYSNHFEAQYIPALCRYLLLQGYRKYQITILTTYTGQLVCLRQFMPKEEFQGIKVTVVDNYQGEENDIIILSLVRSNESEKIGFLKTENRICVALSRAKIGFYILGNFHHLATHSLLWKNIVDDMNDKGKFGDGLKLNCRNHPKKQPIIASKHSDFSKAPEGGCSEICDVRLKCGHKCRRHCHVLDKAHTEYTCFQRCTEKLCKFGHVCPDKCFVTCNPCRVEVPKTMPACGHIQTMQCCIEPSKVLCKEPCEEILKCGHRCQMRCGEPHTFKCEEIVTYTWPYGHKAKIQCWQTRTKDIDYNCPKPCRAVLKCGHICDGSCSKCFSGKVHQPCKQNCKRLLVCGHVCKSFCSNCPPCSARCQNRCVHSKCNKYCGEVCERCTEECSWKCIHFKCTKLCHEPCDRPRCNEPCPEIIEKCGHPCIGLCGEQCPPLCSICDEKRVTEIFFGNEDEENARFVLLEDCGHVIEYEGMDAYMDRIEEEYNIQLKSCPKCKTPIRKCLRYGKVINRTLEDIERVKTEIIGDLTRIEDVKYKLTDIETPRFSRHLLTTRSRLSGSLKSDRDAALIKYKLSSRLAVLEKTNRLFSERQLTTIENQFTIADAIAKIRNTIKKDVSSDEAKKLRLCSVFKALLSEILKDRDILTEQEVEDFKREIERGRIWCKFLELEKRRRIMVGVQESKEVLQDKLRLTALVFETEIFTEEVHDEANSYIERLKTNMKTGGLGITDEERVNIIRALKLNKGHWFKCPNNHIYAIGDCGGANQKSKCPECRAEIGGERHKLSEGNKLAPEMDGATFAAYSEGANNLANFDLRNLH